jgi:hypothetical protein
MCRVWKAQPEGMMSLQMFNAMIHVPSPLLHLLFLLAILAYTLLRLTLSKECLILLLGLDESFLEEIGV